MGRSVIWDKEKVEDDIVPLLEAGKPVAKIAKSYGISRQRLYKILRDLGYNSDGTLIRTEETQNEGY